MLQQKHHFAFDFYGRWEKKTDDDDDDRINNKIANAIVMQQTSVVLFCIMNQQRVLNCWTKHKSPEVLNGRKKTQKGI